MGLKTLMIGVPVAGWFMVFVGLWLGVSLAAALVTGGALLLASATIRIKGNVRQ